MEKKKLSTMLILILLLGNIFQFVWGVYGLPFSKDAIPDEETALRVAEAVLKSVHGDSFVVKVTLVVEQKNGKWYVSAKNWLDKAPGVVIRKHDGKILKIT